MTILYFIAGLSILIVVHELGHFIVARISGIRVERLSVGFGPKLLGIRRGGTEYRVSALLFGGYVKMTGEDISNLDRNDASAFYNKPVFTRAKVVMAGPLMNLLLAVVLLPAVFMIGKNEPAFLADVPEVRGVYGGSPAERAGIMQGDVIQKIDGRGVENWRKAVDEIVISSGRDLNVSLLRGGLPIEITLHVEEMPDGRGGYIGVEPQLFIGNEPVIDSVVRGSPAGSAGLAVGDRVTAVEGKEVESWTDMVFMIGASGGREIIVSVERGAQKLDVSVRPEYSEGAGRFLIGVSKDLARRGVPMVKVRWGFIGGIKEGMAEAGRLFAMTFKVLGRLVTFQLSYKALGGPIQIAQATATAAKQGLASFLYFLAFLSLQLGVLNLLPIPILDGGHVIFFGIEAVRKRPLSERVMGIAQNVGLALLLTLLTVVSINDMMNIGAVRRIVERLF